ISLSNTNSENSSETYQKGFIHQNQINNSIVNGKTPNISGTVAYQHLWLRKPGRVFSAEATVGRQKNNNESEQNNTITYYDEDTDEAIVPDSIVHRGITTDNLQKNYRASVTYSEPL